jgi:two-component system cell cycle response regulator DivK
MGLPDMCGYEVATQLRQLPGFAVTPVVALTGSVMEGERTRVLAAGCSGYLTKPIDVGRFVDQIREQMR